MVFTLKEFHRSNLQDVCDILNLQEEVTSSIKDPTTYIQMSKEELATMLDKGKGIGVYVGDKLVSMGFWVDSSVMDEGNLKEEGYKLNLVSEEERVVEIHHTITHPQYRNRGLQTRIIKELIESVPKDTRFIMITVHPNNAQSRHNIEKTFDFVAKIEYKMLPRLLYLKKISL